MKITIDEKKCLKYKLTFKEFLVALTIKNLKDPKSVIDTLVNRDILDIKDDKYVVTDKWSETLDKILTESGGNLNDERLRNLADKIREIFPKGYKQDDKGNKYYHKSEKLAVKQALERFIKHYGDYPDEEILDAAKRYVDGFNGNYVPPFQMANYFICKDNRTKGGDLQSQLATLLENKESDKDITNTSNDWLMNMRN